MIYIERSDLIGLILGENIESVAQMLIIDFEDETLHNGILSTFRDQLETVFIGG